MRPSLVSIRPWRLLALASLGLAISAPAALAAAQLPVARADSVGMSSERLARLPEGMKALVDNGKLAGVVTMVSRHGKVVEFDATGKRDIATQRADAKGQHISHLLHE